VTVASPPVRDARRAVEHDARLARHRTTRDRDVERDEVGQPASELPRNVASRQRPIVRFGYERDDPRRGERGRREDRDAVSAFAPS